MQQKALIVGGGFYGMYLAEYIAKQGLHVCICERGSDYMQRASYTNQARVHHGYHYPRSVLTALRSRVDFLRFSREFTDCIDSSFDKYYLIGRIQSNVTAKQFARFCDRIGADYREDKGWVYELVNPHQVEAVFAVEETAFNSDLLKRQMLSRLEKQDIDRRLNTQVESILKVSGGLKAKIQSNGNEKEEIFDHVFNCTYSLLNKLTTNSNLARVPLKHELTEMCLVSVPEPLKGVGLTVMCGPFFSTMPFPPQGLHSFSHVRYTPHFNWFDKTNDNYENGYKLLHQYRKRSAWRNMVSDARRFIPILEQCEYHDSLWEVKTTLPSSESDDSRPILFLPNHGLDGFHCVLGGKIDNIYDVITEIETIGLMK